MIPQANHIDKKREMIVDAAYRVCLRKPVQMVNITDVIAEAGLSMGAIYRYYPSLDDIFVDMVSKMRKEYNIIDRLDKLTKDPGVPFEEITYQVCDVLGEVMEKHLMDIQKINFDLGVLAINEPDRMARISKDLKGTGNSEYLGAVVLPRLAMASAMQGHKIKGDAEELGQYLGATFTGIEKYCILTACYGPGDAAVKAEPKKLFRTFTFTVYDAVDETMYNAPGTRRSIPARVYYPVSKDSVKDLPKARYLTREMIAVIRKQYMMPFNYDKAEQDGSNRSECYENAPAV